MVVALGPFNRLGEAHPIMEGDWLYSKSADLNVNHILKNTFIAACRLEFDQTALSQLSEVDT